MSIGQYMDGFLKFEYENNLFKEDIRGFKYWHYVRFAIYIEILTKKENIGQGHTRLSEQKYIKLIWLKIKQIPDFILKNPIWFLKPKDVIILPHKRKVKNGEYYNCIYIDEIANNLGHSYYIFEQSYLEKHFKPIKTKNVRYMDYVGFKIDLYREFMKKIYRFKLTKEETKRIKGIIENLNNDLGVDLEYNKIIQIIIKLYLIYKASLKHYKKILDKVKPKVIIQVVSYGMDRFIINELAKERGIPVVELQHGTMGKYHVAYNFAQKMELPTFPDYIFTFGQFWKDNTRFPIDSSRVKVVGWPYYEEKVKRFVRINEKGKKNEKKRVILFISQGTIGKQLSNIAVDLSNQVDLEKNKIIYKLHPGEYARWMKEYPWLIDANLEVVDKNEHDMHYYFAQADIQVGVYSTALFEGLGYGLDTYVFKFYGHQYMEELYKKGIVKLLETSNQLKELLEKEMIEPQKIKSTYLWESNSISNMTSQIKGIIKIH